jgi:hypothetical protein
MYSAGQSNHHRSPTKRNRSSTEATQARYVTAVPSTDHHRNRAKRCSPGHGRASRCHARLRRWSSHSAGLQVTPDRPAQRASVRGDHEVIDVSALRLMRYARSSRLCTAHSTGGTPMRARAEGRRDAGGLGIGGLTYRRRAQFPSARTQGCESLGNSPPRAPFCNGPTRTAPAQVRTTSVRLSVSAPPPRVRP